MSLPLSSTSPSTPKRKSGFHVIYRIVNWSKLVCSLEMILCFMKDSVAIS